MLAIFSLPQHIKSKSVYQSVINGMIKKYMIFFEKKKTIQYICCQIHMKIYQLQ